MVDEAGNLIVLRRPSTVTFVFFMPLFYALLYGAAYLWTLYVDPFCARFVDWMTYCMFKDEGRIYLREKHASLGAKAVLPK